MSADREIARIAKRMHGLTTVRDAELAGLSADQRWRQIQGGRLEMPEPGVLKVAGAPLTWRQQLLAKCLTESGYATMRASAALYRREGCEPHVMDVVVHRWERRPNASVRNLHESTRLTDADVTEIDGVPCVTIEWTLLTLGAVVSAAKVEAALDDALRRELTTPERLWALYLRIRGRGVRGIGVVKPMIIRRLGTHGRRPNGFEHKLRRIVKRAGLPELTPQWEIRDGGFLAFADWAWPDRGVTIECVSDEWHSGRVRRHRDTTRRNHILRLGILVLEFTHDHVTREKDYVAEECWAAYRTGGRDLA
jgi:hypothetical protein